MDQVRSFVMSTPRSLMSFTLSINVQRKLGSLLRPPEVYNDLFGHFVIYTIIKEMFYIHTHSTVYLFMYVYIMCVCCFFRCVPDGASEVTCSHDAILVTCRKDT